MRRVLFVLLWLVAGAGSAATYPCPGPPSASEVSCTYASIGGTTTYTATVTAQAMGSSLVNSAIELTMYLDGMICNPNAGERVPVTLATNGTATVVGQCTFDVTSDRLVHLFAHAQSQNATPGFISLTTTIDRFLPDEALTTTALGNGTITSLDGRINCGVDCFELFAANANVTLAANPAFGWAFTGWSGDCSGDARTCVVTMSQARNVTATFALLYTQFVVEFYNAALDHYFMTAEPLEATAIDNGSAGPGWVRTGLTFKAGGDTPVCRFFGSTSPGPNSHFYTANAQECFGLKQLAAATPNTQPRWNFETIAFSTQLPVNGVCPAGTIAVHRAYNDGFARHKDSNHRYTTSASALQDVLSRGWKYEGVAMCAPA